MNTTGQDKPGGRPGAPPTNIWVPVLVAAIGATSAIGAAVIMRPPPQTPLAAQTAKETPPSVTGGAQVETASTDVAPQTAVGAAPTTAVDYRQQVLGYLDQQHKPLTDAGYARDTGAMDWIGLLRVGTPKVWEVELVRGGDYQVVGVCDSDCKDVDMEIYDMTGSFVGRDTLVDDYPRVQFRPAQSGVHTVKVWLRDCNSADGTQSCMVATRILRR